MLRSSGFWCTLISMVFCDFGLYGLLKNVLFLWNIFSILLAIWAVVPEYMSEVLLFSIEENGLLSALPHLASFLVVVTSGGFADFLIERKYLKRVNTRKLFHGVGTLAPAICLLIISFLDCESRYLAVILLIVGVAFRSRWFSKRIRLANERNFFSF